MFQIMFADRAAWQGQSSANVQWTSSLSAKDVAKSLYLTWEEHCVECAAPDCYRTCPLYIPRKDENCARFAYGIYANPRFSGEFGFGADIRFRRWGKLEAGLNRQSVATPVLSHSTFEKFSRLPGRVRTLVTLMLGVVSDTRMQFDDFVLECFSPNTETFKLAIQYSAQGEIKFRHAFEIRPGHNFFTVPASEFKLVKEGYLYLIPEESPTERRLIFSWLSFVKYRAAERPAAKVKCLVWDLDNTVWNGILVETEDPNQLQLKPGVLQTIQELDKRGVIQSIASKNSHDEAWAQLKRLGIDEYFVYPAINWQPKSENLKVIADKLNIGIDTFAFIDDSAFERDEVKSVLSNVRIFTDQEVEQILGKPEFDLPITVASKTRRLSYQTEMRRESEQAKFSGSYEDFLIGCQIQLEIKKPESADEIKRCWELIQRTNQLNLSGKRYSEAEFNQKLATPGEVGLSLSVKDRFGEWGIVGFAMVNVQSTPPKLTDFVLSCRVAQKKVEHSFLQWLASELASNGAKELLVDLVETKKNLPLRQVFRELPFESVSKNGERSLLKLNLDRPIEMRAVLQILGCHPEFSKPRQVANL